MKNLIEKIFNITNEEEFNATALEIFRFQYNHVEIYHRYVDMLGKHATQITKLEEIPFLPISMFKFHKILTNNYKEEIYFTSSGTTGNETSTHYIADKTLYERSFFAGFEHFMGDISQYVILALLPSYLERKHSSLVYMVDGLIQKTKSEHSGFYLHNLKDLVEKLRFLQQNHIKTILFGVSFALLDLVEQFQLNFPELIVFETGGMKTKRKEMPRKELHEILSKGFSVPIIYSEYGMTELLSQAYSLNGETFSCPPWMKIILRDPQDPLSQRLSHEKKGGINVIDLANLYSCSFIATQDVGKQAPNGTFEVLGRFDQAELRGCNLLLEEI